MSEPNSPSSVPAWLERLTRAQAERPWPWIVVALALALASLPPILGVPALGMDGLTLNSDFTALLPESAQSVQDLEEIQERFGGQQPMAMTIESSDEEALHRFVRDLAPRIQALEANRVVALDWNISDFSDFVETHRHLYADLEDLEEIRDALDERLEHERAVANPFYIDLGDEEDTPPDPRETIEGIQRDADEAREEMEERYPEGFLQRPERPLVLVIIHTRINGGAIDETLALRAAIDAEIAELDPDSYADDIQVHYGGNLIEILEETNALIAAVRNATLITIAMVMAAIFVFFLRARPIPLLFISLLSPVLVTFAFAELTVDYLNASSAFLSAIVIGNGVNPNVIWLARYFEARRAGRSVHESILKSHRGTWKGTLTASLAAAVAYGSLITTDYRGFRDFGMIGGMGMVLCWLAAYLLLPALTAQSERWRPLLFKKKTSHNGFYGVLFSKIALGSPRVVLGVSALVTASAVALCAWAIVNDPMEYDYRKLSTERDEDSDIAYVVRATQGILDDTKTGAALAVLAESSDDIPRFRAQLEAYREEHPNDFGEVEAIDDLLPEDQAAKVEVIAELRRLMLEIRPHVDEELQALIDEHVPSEDTRPLTPDDLPASVARPFTERDGTRGRLLFVEHNLDENIYDGLYIERWARSARTVRTEGADGPPPVAGTAVVFSDLMSTVWRDGPRAIGVAFVATVLLLLVTFRTAKDRLLTLAALLVGILWMAGTMAAFGMHLNFLNFVAFPITFGNGVDYGVNVMRRYADEREGGAQPLDAVRASVEGTGGAVILCSLTTVIGYISLYTSTNQALNSFGEAMAISEVTCLLAAVLALPAALFVIDRRRAERTAKRDAPPSAV